MNSNKPARDTFTTTLTASLIPALIVLGAAIAFGGCAAGDTAPGPMGSVTPAPTTEKPATAGAAGSAGSDGSAGATGSAGAAGSSEPTAPSEPAETVVSDCPASAPTSGTCSIVLVCTYGATVYVCNPGAFWDGAPSSSTLAAAQRIVDGRAAKLAASKADADRDSADRALAVDLAMCDHVTEAQAIANCSQGSTTVTACSASVMCAIAKDYQTARNADAAAVSADAKAASYN